MRQLLFCFLLLQLNVFGQMMQYKTGGGNLNNGLFDPSNMQRIGILEMIGAKIVRVNLYPNDYWDFVNNVPKTNYADALLLDLAAKDIRVVLLFEHYANFPSLGQPLGTYTKWQQIGAAFAGRYREGSAFFMANGVTDYGIEYYTAINEPDIGGFMPKTIAESPENYHDAIEGLADGVHSVDANLKVIPGGFAAENAMGSHTLNGFGTAIADLFNNGKLYGIDLHTYNDVAYAPILKNDNTNHVEFMAFYDFQQVKTACGITADIKFCPTEFGFKENTQGINSQLAAKRLLTCIWGNLGAVGNDGFSSACEYALIWNIFNTVFEDPVYGMCYSRNPYNPNPKGTIFNTVVGLTKDMEFEHLDPFDKGEFTLNSSTKKMWVFQNYPLLSSIHGTTYTINQIPSNTTEIQVYNWNGLQTTVINNNFSSYTFTGLNANETYMFVAIKDPIDLQTEETTNPKIVIYPNPFDIDFSIQNCLYSFEIFDAKMTKICDSKQNIKPYETIGTDFTSGVYFIQFETGEVQKIIKR